MIIVAVLPIHRIEIQLLSLAGVSISSYRTQELGYTRLRSGCSKDSMID